jgi:phage baseplate assembly protein W
VQHENSFLGTGWAFPPVFASGGTNVEMVSDAEDIEQSLRILLSTQPGERVMQEFFGCDLHGVLFEEVDQSLVNAITRLVEDAILYHEPRIRLDRITVTESTAEPGEALPSAGYGGATLFISIHYTVRGTNSRYNMVYPFYLEEAALPGLSI